MVCSTCKKEKPLEYFEIRSDYGTYRKQCRKCHKGYETLKGQFKQRIVDGKKHCGKCKRNQPISEYHIDKNTSSGLTSWCASCKQEYQIANKERIRAKTASTRYNITIEMALSLNSVTRCDICDSELLGARRAIDHCHKTGKVRGVLCRTCNHGLGFFRDDIKLLGKAIRYLRK